MENKDLKAFSTIFYGLAEEYGGTISKNGIKLKFEAMKHFSIEDISKAANWIMLNRVKTFPAVPTVAEFSKAIESFKIPQISLDDKAEMQAAIVLKKLKYDGRNGKNDFEDPITKSIMTDRWPYQSWAAEILEKEIQWWQKQFITLYKSYNGHEKADLLIEGPGRNMLPASNMNSLVDFGMDIKCIKK